MSVEDLRPNITSTRQAQEMGRKGGQKTSLAKKMIHRIYCDSKCILYVTCWAKHIADRQYMKGETKKRECALKKMPSELTEAIYRIHKEGEEGLHKELLENFMKMKQDVLLDPMNSKLKARFSKVGCDVAKTIYGNKQRIEGTMQNEISVESISQMYDKHLKSLKKKKVN